MTKALAILILLWVPALASGNETRSGIEVSTTLAQRLAVRSVVSEKFSATTNYPPILAPIIRDLDFAGSASFLEHLPPAKLKTFTLDAAPKTPQTVRMSRTEAKTLIKWLVSNPKAPWDVSFARVLVALVDDVNEALAKGRRPGRSNRHRAGAGREEVTARAEP